MGTNAMRSHVFENAEVTAAGPCRTVRSSNRGEPEIKLADVKPETLVSRIADLVHLSSTKLQRLLVRGAGSNCIIAGLQAAATR